MEDLTFGEQVKIVLGRKGMTIKELAATTSKSSSFLHSVLEGIIFRNRI